MFEMNAVYLQKLIMDPRLHASRIDDPAVFDIGMASYEPLSYKMYLDPEIKYGYNIGSLLFKPTKEVIVHDVKENIPFLMLILFLEISLWISLWMPKRQPRLGMGDEQLSGIDFPS